MSKEYACVSWPYSPNICHKSVFVLHGHVVLPYVIRVCLYFMAM